MHVGVEGHEVHACVCAHPVEEVRGNPRPGVKLGRQMALLLHVVHEVGILLLYQLLKDALLMLLLGVWYEAAALQRQVVEGRQVRVGVGVEVGVRVCVVVVHLLLQLVVHVVGGLPRMLQLLFIHVSACPVVTECPARTSPTATPIL